MVLGEVKGYPSASYRDPHRVNERKLTNPTNQAEKWFSHTLLKVLRLQTAHPQAKVAIAYPELPRYRVLFDETKLGPKLGLAILMVDSSGRLSTWRFE